MKKVNKKLIHRIEILEQELKIFRTKLKEMDAKNNLQLEFIVHLAHEFKTPLSAIYGFAQLMQERDLERKKQIRFLKNIINASKHMANLLAYTIDMAMAQTDKIVLKIEEFSPSDVIEEVLSVLEIKIQEKSIQLTKELASGVICADKRRFRQVIFNLVGNAYKFNRQGGFIKIRTVFEDKNFYFEIHDTGIGIPEQEQNKIFEFFTHINIDRFENEDRSGIGLSVCKKIVNLHGGEITFESCYQKGSVFRFYLPIKAGILGEHVVVP